MRTHKHPRSNPAFCACTSPTKPTHLPRPLHHHSPGTHMSGWDFVSSISTLTGPLTSVSAPRGDPPAWRPPPAHSPALSSELVWSQRSGEMPCVPVAGSKDRPILLPFLPQNAGFRGTREAPKGAGGEGEAAVIGLGGPSRRKTFISPRLSHYARRQVSPSVSWPAAGPTQM